MAGGEKGSGSARPSWFCSRSRDLVISFSQAAIPTSPMVRQRTLLAARQGFLFAHCVDLAWARPNQHQHQHQHQTEPLGVSRAPRYRRGKGTLRAACQPR